MVLSDFGWTGEHRKAIEEFMLVMQFRRDLKDAREIIIAAFPGQETRIDPDIAQANTALIAAALQVEATRA